MASLRSLVVTAAWVMFGACATCAFPQTLEPRQARPGYDYMRLGIERCEARKCSTTAPANVKLACAYSCSKNDDSPGICMQSCVGDPFCKAFTYDATRAQCFLKSDAAPAVSKLDSTSGVVPRAPKPFHVVILGDSVMWGQGLSVDQKFTTRTIALLQNNRWARPLGTVFNQSHSGASLGDIGQDANVDPTPSFIHQGIAESVAGEIPRDHPLVWVQEQTILDAMAGSNHALEPDDVAWVMIDGGANDMGFIHTIVDSDIVPQDPDASVDSIQGRALRLAGARMRPMLDRVCGHFKNANVIVTGYYAFLDRSDAIRSSTFWGELVAVYGYFDLKLLAGFVMPAYDLSARSMLFANYINSELRDATTQSVACKGRAIFVSPDMSGFEDNNVQNIFTPANDPVTIPRKAACDVVRALNPPSLSLSQTACEHASLFHPNHLGADRYYQRIRDAVTTTYPAWTSTKRKMVVDRTFSGNRVQVSAFDAETRAQLYGAVLVSGITNADSAQPPRVQRVAGETDSVISFQPCYRPAPVKHCPSTAHGHANCDPGDPGSLAPRQPVACTVAVSVGGYEE